VRVDMHASMCFDLWRAGLVGVRGDLKSHVLCVSIAC
jgi:hypothetical protein